MRINLVQVRNIAGVKTADLELGQITMIKGRNGSNKTSIIDAIKYAVGGGHNATLLHQGAEEGEVVLVFDNEMRVEKQINQSGSSLTVNGKKKDAQTIVNNTFGSLGVNPISFITAPADKRADILLRTVPLEFDHDQQQVLKRAGATAADFLLHPLVTIAGVRQRVYDDRTVVNRLVKEKRGSIEQLSLSLPPNMGEVDFQTEIDALDTELAQLSNDHHSRLSSINETRANEKLVASNQYAETHAKLQSEMRAEIEKIKAEYQALADDAKRHRDEAIELSSHVADAAISEATSEYSPMIEEKKAELVKLRAQAEETQRARTLLEQIHKFEADEKRQQEISDKMTDTLRQIDEVKISLLSTLPAGLEVRDKQIFVNDLPFDRLNTAEQFKIAMAIWKLRSPFVVVDGAECLDSESQRELEEAVIEAGMQMIMTCVADCDLTVEQVEMDARHQALIEQ